jgi:hypothetical protein
MSGWQIVGAVVCGLLVVMFLWAMRDELDAVLFAVIMTVFVVGGTGLLVGAWTP